MKMSVALASAAAVCLMANMRKTLLATSALVAALAFAGAASAQNVSVRTNQNNTAVVGSNLTINGRAVGGNLTGNSTAIGNLSQVTARTGQGIAEISATGVDAQVNSGAITANAYVESTQAANGTFASTAAGNVINLDGISTFNYDGRIVGQNNGGNINATLTLQGGANSLGNLNANSQAIGNSINADAIGAVQLGAGQGGGGGVVRQTNGGAQTALTNFVFGGNSTTVNASATAVANTISADSPFVGLSATQINNGDQTATLNFNQGTQAAVVGTTAAANVISLNGGSFSTATGLSQANYADQLATTNINGVSVFNGGSLTASASAMGNVISVVQNGTVSLPVGAQLNGATQTAVVNGNGGSVTGAANLSAQGIGNLISVDSNNMVTSAMTQTNYGTVSATTNVFGGAFGTSMAANSLAAGNVLQIDGLQSMSGTITTPQLNGGSITSLTNVVGGSFAGSLNVGATSIGNLSSVGIR